MGGGASGGARTLPDGVFVRYLHQMCTKAYPWIAVLCMRDPLVRLLGVAAPQHGLFTLVQASEVDVVDAQVRQMAARGVLERRSVGVYRITTIPFDAYTEFMEAVLWAKVEP